MNRCSFIRHLPVCVLMLSLACACTKEEDFDAIYGSGSPLAENIISCDRYIYEYNGQGLVTKVSNIVLNDGVSEAVTIATISYPKSDRAVMEYRGDYLPTTYTFAFGKNHFANRVIAADADGESWMTKFSYDDEGHVTSIDDELKMEWTDGNLTKIMQDEYDASTVLTYGSQTDFGFYNMSPFLLYINLGPFMNTLDWWYERGLEVALHIGFLGRPCRNLPATIVSYDSENKTPQRGTFRYSYDEDMGGDWQLVYE